MQARLNAYAGPLTLDRFWAGVHSGIRDAGDVYSAKPALPLNRIRTILRLDDDLEAMLLAKELLKLLSQACHMFIKELAWRAWQLVREHKRNTLQVFAVGVTLLPPPVV